MAGFFSKKQYAAVSGVFYLCYVLQFIIDSFNQSSFSKQNLVGNSH